MTYVPADDRYGAMRYRRSGRSGLDLPLVSLGLWHNFGGVDPLERSRAIVRRAFDLGITHFDLANNYGPPYGSAEETFGKLLRDVNTRYVRARLPQLDRGEALAAVDALAAGESVHGIRPEEVLHLPDRRYFRRRGVPAFEMVGVDGAAYGAFDAYVAHLRDTLPESYLAGCDFREYLEALRQIDRGELTLEAAVRRMPELRRVGGSCPCSRAVRWVVDEPAAPALPAT